MVIVLDKRKRPLGFTTERRARKLMERRRAVMYRMFPMTIIVKDVDARNIPDLPEYRIKTDPGAKTDGIAVVNDKTGELMLGMQVEHRAETVKSNMDTRRGARRSRRSRETLYRRKKFGTGTFRQEDNHRIPPSVRSIIGNTESWITKLSRWIRITEASIEAVRFDTQLLDNPEIRGTGYQHGTLYGTEIREYLLEKYQHVCQYCGGESKDPVLEWEHMIPKSRGGSDKLSNATLACRSCNREKNAMTPEEWLRKIQAKQNPAKLDTARISGIQNVLSGRRTGGSNRYCAWVNITRRSLESFLFGKFGTAECSSGGRTKYNRERMNLPKDHQYDAACVGHVPACGWKDRTHGYYVLASATGRGTRFRGKTNKCGIITRKLAPREKRVFGFMNGDIVSAKIPKQKKKPYRYEGHYTGRVMTRKSGSFDIRTTAGKLITANVKFVRMIQYADGYQYRLQRTEASG